MPYRTPWASVCEDALHAAELMQHLLRHIFVQHARESKGAGVRDASFGFGLEMSPSFACLACIMHCRLCLHPQEIIPTRLLQLLQQKNGPA